MYVCCVPICQPKPVCQPGCFTKKNVHDRFEILALSDGQFGLKYPRLGQKMMRHTRSD